MFNNRAVCLTHVFAEVTISCLACFVSFWKAVEKRALTHSICGDNKCKDELCKMAADG